MTISAVLVFLGCGLALMLSLFITLGLALIPGRDTAPPFSKFAALSGAIFMMGLAVWGIGTGVYLLKLREWARVSMLAFSGLLLLVTIPGAIIMLFAPIALPPNTPNPESMQPVIAVMRVVMVFFYGLLAVLGGWWLYFFNIKGVKEQFRRPVGAGAGESAQTWQPPAVARSGPRRPLSITIIAYLALIGAFCYPVLLALHLPMMFLGFFFNGRQATLIILGFMTVQLLMAYGLLRLEPWARNLGIYFFNFAIFNSVISVILPGAQARYDDAISATQATMGLPASPTKFPIWIGLMSSLPIIGVQLWFLISRRKAFEERHDGPTWPT